ncbi:MAG: MBL fold metallo-hydrolase [Verrucomicrobiaceae bacterium]|nr:MBL fold metallo-hydrolase [Verrucomicrobiaceae bacterium]
MKIYDFQLGQLGTNTYLIVPENSDSAILVDCPYEAVETIPHFLKQIDRKLEAILLTHGHWDHIWDTAELAKITGAKVYASKFGTHLIEDADLQREVLFSGDGLQSAHIDIKINDGDEFEIAGVKIKCLEAFGHSPDSIVYYIESENIAFVGDVLFAGSIGRTDLWEGNYAQLEKSIKTKLYTLPNDTRVLNGHGPETSIGVEKKSNCFVRG